MYQHKRCCGNFEKTRRMQGMMKGKHENKRIRASGQNQRQFCKGTLKSRKEKENNLQTDQSKSTQRALSSSQEPIFKKRAKTSSDPRLNNSTPRAGSQTRPAFFMAGFIGDPSDGEIGPAEDAGELREDSLELCRAITEGSLVVVIAEV